MDLGSLVKLYGGPSSAPSAQSNYNPANYTNNPRSHTHGGHPGQHSHARPQHAPHDPSAPWRGHGRGRGHPQQHRNNNREFNNGHGDHDGVGHAATGGGEPLGDGERGGRGGSRGRGGRGRGGARGQRGGSRGGSSGHFRGSSRGRGRGGFRGDPELQLPWHVTQQLARATSQAGEEYRRERLKRWPSKQRIAALRLSAEERTARGELLSVPPISLQDLHAQTHASKRGRGGGSHSASESMLRSLLSATVRKERQAMLQCIHYLLHVTQSHSTAQAAESSQPAQ